ncbi:MAG: nucleotidyltransferase domain-containing protein [Chlamydiae bacterium]|nr:nucleotidyltransferase domain-containing protein [Chlamydiota bacterium]MBI3276952.1 nucleotidyltransferase domain-containing protein [Chlamydiota bacterium]
MEIDRNIWKLLFQPFSKIELAYLFGSQVIGVTHPESDIDIALLVQEELTPFEEARLAASISREIDIKKIDIVTLNHATSLLKYEALANGLLVYQKVSDDCVNRFEMGVYREYFDTEHIRKLQYDLLFGER